MCLVRFFVANVINHAFFYVKYMPHMRKWIHVFIEQYLYFSVEILHVVSIMAMKTSWYIDASYTEETSFICLNHLLKKKTGNQIYHLNYAKHVVFVVLRALATVENANWPVIAVKNIK
jgi:hypothetical protein